MFSTTRFLVLSCLSAGLVCTLPAQLQIQFAVPGAEFTLGNGSANATVNPATFTYNFATQGHEMSLVWSAPAEQRVSFTTGETPGYFYVHYVSIEEGSSNGLTADFDHFEPITATFAGLQGTLTQEEFAEDGYTGSTRAGGGLRYFEIGAAFTVAPNSTVSFQSMTLSWLVPAEVQFVFSPTEVATANVSHFGGDFSYVAAVPEPATTALLGGALALGGALVWRRRPWRADGSLNCAER